MDPSMFNKTSPISCFCANLVQVLRGVDHLAALHFFCSQHVASNDGLRGPQGLVRSLISQLAKVVLGAGQSDPAEVATLTNLDTTTSMDRLCNAFQLLLEQLPLHTAVFCVIDDVSRFEKDEWYADYVVLMDMLSSAVSWQGIMFKLLFTSPTKSRWLQGKVAPSQHIALRGPGHEVGAGTERSRWSTTLEAMWSGPSFK